MQRAGIPALVPRLESDNRVATVYAADLGAWLSRWEAGAFVPGDSCRV